jgi:CTP:molybdopterin cytidylyltransferase MocA
MNVEKGESGLDAIKQSGLKTICVNADNEYEVFDVDTKDDLKELMET